MIKLAEVNAGICTDVISWLGDAVTLLHRAIMAKMEESGMAVVVMPEAASARASFWPP